MDTQTLRTLCTGIAPAEPAQVCSRDYGFDYDEEEIAREMLAPLPAELSNWAISQSEADEFDSVSLRFLS